MVVGQFRTLGLSLAAALVLLGSPLGAAAQGSNTGPLEPTVQEAPRVFRTTGSRVAIGRSIHIDRDEEVNDAVVVIGGSLRVDGRVRDGVVVVGGSIDLGPESEVRGDVVVVGGVVRREAGSRLFGRVSDITFGEWSPWRFGRWEIPYVTFGGFGRWFALFGAIFRISILAVLMALVLVVARGPVARVGRTAGAQPGQALLVGLAAEILFVPALIVASVALVMTIIGIPLVVVLIPTALLAGGVALLLGFTSVACRVGEWLEDRLGWRGHSAFLATAVGLLVIIAPTMIARVIGVAPFPVRMAGFGLLITGVIVEFIVWTIGLGATLMTGFGRWSTIPPPVPPPPPAPSLPVAFNA